MQKVKGLHLVIAILIIFIILVPSGPAQALGGPVEDITGGSEHGVELVLRADGAPALGGTAHLTLVATPLIDAPNLEIRWVIPQGVELIGTEIDTFPGATINQPVQSERTLRFSQTGTFKIAVSVRLIFGPDFTYGTSGVLFFIIDSNGSRVTDKDPDAHKPDRHDPSNKITITSTPSNKPLAPNEDPCFTIAVHAQRYDYQATPDGFVGPTIVPMAGWGMEFRESDPLYDDSYGTLDTDANGNLVGSFCDDDGWLDDELEIYIRITAARGNPSVYVEDSSWLDEIYEFDTDYQSSTGGYLSFDIILGDNWSPYYNIVDAGVMAYQLWVDSGGTFEEETEIHYEPGYGDDKSYYDELWKEITIADGPSDPDPWDDAILMHEWGHFADDYYSCDDSPGGDHAPGEVIDTELSWGEGYPTYYSSAVRDYYDVPYSNWMLDINGSGIPGNKYNLEDESYPINVGNQGSISSVLWDLYDDSPYDYPDNVNYGHAAIQNIYISSAFKDEAYGFFDDTCDFDTYMRGWVDSGMPADRDTAAIVMYDTGYTLAPARQVAQSTGHGSIQSDYTAADVYRWWKQLTYVADNSLSMNGPKFDAIKTLFVEAVNDLGEDPEGTEFKLDLFNNTGILNETAFAGQFYPADLINPINALTTETDDDPNCVVNALYALTQAAADREKGDIWLFTDGDTTQVPSVQAIRQQLTENQLRTSIALMGLCAKSNQDKVLSPPMSVELLDGLTLEEQQTLMAKRLLPGAARAELGLMADNVPGGLVPYLLTAINSGGQFLYVDESQVEDAADILRAQITNSAGAGKWSDYVSDSSTYRYDSLASWEYKWVDAKALGTRWDNPTQNQKIDIPFPAPGYFQFFSGPYFANIHIFEDGYLNFGLDDAYVPLNTTLPNPADPNSALYPFWDNMEPYCPPTADASAPNCDMQGGIYTYLDGDWFAIEYDKYESYTTGYPLNTFEVLFNMDTYEIRYQYKTVPNGAESSTIGLEDGSGTTGIQISYNDVGYAADGMGYKFVPAPPQPTQTYIVPVDSTMQSVGFLLTGYSGSFEPMLITDPDGTPVDCSDLGTYCLDLDLVQYVQVNTNGHTGDWQAVVDAGSSGSGTYSFTSFATSPISVEGQFHHTLSTGTQQLLVHLNGQVDGNVLTGHFNLANGDAFGYNFTMYDDGLHGDSLPGDGYFGNNTYYPPGAGAAYLTLQGLYNGEAFTRIDPVPYTFQPLRVLSLGEGANYGGVTQVQFQFTNYDIYDHCYWLTYSIPAGWWIDFAGPPPYGGCLSAGQTATLPFDIYMSEGYTNDLASGTTGILTISATEWEKGLISDSDSTRITRYRLPDRIEIFNPTFYIRPNGDTAKIRVEVFDSQDVMVADGTEVTLSATMGLISPQTAITKDGYFLATFTSGAEIGTAIIYAQTENSVIGTTAIDIGNPKPSQIQLLLSDNLLPADGVSTAQLVATVRDRWGDPVANQAVNIGVEGDGQLGTIDGGEVVSGYTNAAGQFTATFTSGLEMGAVGVRAELVVYKVGEPHVAHHDRGIIFVGGALTHLPMIQR